MLWGGDRTNGEKVDGKKKDDGFAALDNNMAR